MIGFFDVEAVLAQAWRFESKFSFPLNKSDKPDETAAKNFEDIYQSSMLMFQVLI